MLMMVWSRYLLLPLSVPSPLPLLLLCLPVSNAIAQVKWYIIQQLGLDSTQFSTCYAGFDQLNCLIDCQHHFSWGKSSFLSDYLLISFSSARSPLSISLLIYPRRLHQEEWSACNYHERDPAVFARLSIRRFASGVTSRNVSAFLYLPLYRATPSFLTSFVYAHYISFSISP